MARTGLPHSEMYGSLPACGSPYLFAAYRVLHRLSMPRHPPYALCSLITPLPVLFPHNFVAPSLISVDVPFTYAFPHSLVASRSAKKSLGNIFSATYHTMIML